jgi:DNA-binding IscR family transcriptional regulator
MKDVRDAIAKILESVTVAELCRRARELQSHPAHPSDYVI